LVIFLIAAVLRFYRLGENPPSLDWDEASMGYNAYSLLLTGKDEYGNAWPISIRSFNDYKPPLYTYTLIPTIAVFGLNEFAVRFPSALAGTLTVLVTYFLVAELFSHKNSKFEIRNSKFLPAIAAGLLAISPWHLQFSRVAFEANLALFFFVLAVFLLAKALLDIERDEKKLKMPAHRSLRFAKRQNMQYAQNRETNGGENGKWKIKNISYLFAASVSFVATMYAYHSARIIVPVFVLIAAVVYRHRIGKMKRAVIPAAAVGFLLLVPVFLTLLRGFAQARFTTVSVFTNPGIYTRESEKLTRQSEYRLEDEQQNSFLFVLHHPWLVYTLTILEGYFDHYNLDFLFLKGDGIGRHSASGMGLLYLFELPFALVGVYALVKNKEPALRMIIPWLIVAPLASAMTTQTPHAVRSLLMLPALTIISAYGMIHVVHQYKKYRYVLGLVGVLAIVNVVYYLDLYYIQTPIERSHDWQYGYKQLVQNLSLIEATSREIIVTTEYDQPYIFFLFYNKIDPSWYQTVSEKGPGGFAKYVFRKIDYDEDALLSETAIAGSPKEIPDQASKFDTIQYLNGDEAFRIVQTH